MSRLYGSLSGSCPDLVADTHTQTQTQTQTDRQTHTEAADARAAAGGGGGEEEEEEGVRSVLVVGSGSRDPLASVPLLKTLRASAPANGPPQPVLGTDLRYALRHVRYWPMVCAYSLMSSTGLRSAGTGVVCAYGRWGSE
eukprot:1860584-Rhodomonas_salina.1